MKIDQLKKTRHRRQKMNLYLVNNLFKLGTDILDDKWNHIDQVFDLILDEFGYSLEERQDNDVARDLIFGVMNGEIKQKEAIKRLAILLEAMKEGNDQKLEKIIKQVDINGKNFRH